MSGDEIYIEAKKNYPDLPFVIITAFADSEMMNNILKHGPVTVLRKPLKTGDLEETMRHLGRKTAGKSKSA